MVHGGSEFTKSVILDDGVLDRIAKYNELIRIADTNSRLGLAKPF